ncbi:MAG TPA: DNA mismatch repair endonuclease MutL [Acidobacteriota bacterium]|nr:DNA mismatch repair endonuclease MutL [Acidobacteriota bacterium]
MNKIRVLPEILANKIAAGEIVERPASVVKELMENSLDAGARSISISVESGGKRLILVRDDGEGMSQDDAILAFEHHATSKLQTVEDLGAIATLGFRGEALPSIASISRLNLKTRLASAPDSVPGAEIEIQGGTIRSVKPISWDKGTEVTVRDLFFNVPARRKFLRSHETELGHITRLTTQYALAHPEIRFGLESDGRSLLSVAPVPSIRERIFQLFGDGFLENLVEVSGAAADVSVQGFSSQPHEQRTNPYSQFFYVNRRMVRDKVITSAVRQAYRNCMPASAYPVAMLFVELPYDQVDVNAHPAKTEIRFRQQNVVHDLVRDAIARALIQAKSIPSYEHRSDAWAPAWGGPPPRDGAGWPPTSPDPFNMATAPSPLPDAIQRAFNYPFRELQAPTPPAEAHSTMKLRADLLLGAPTSDARPFNPAGVRILGQIQDSYIIACDNSGLLIIDQHVAHERILYERLAAARQGNSMEVQGLLVPITLELPPHQVAILERVLPELNRNGFDVERFGGNAVLIRSVPAIAKDSDCRKLLTEILEGLESEERTCDVARIRDRIAVSTACRAAIKVHMPLTPEKMQWLLDELSQTRIPTNCPHGRPIILRFSLYEIERNFGRI